jgi:hypothetical protein
MTITMITRWSALAGGIVLTLGLAAGCSGSKSPSSSSLAGGGLPTSTAGVGNNGSVDAKICAAIATDVAAITKNVSTPHTFPGQCAFGGGATTVSFNVNDPQHSDVTNVLGSTADQLSGIGDGAVWGDNGGHTVPTLGAWKGNVSCLVQPDSDVSNDTLTFTGTPPLVTIADADGAAYAQKLGAICSDVFTAAS